MRWSWTLGVCLLAACAACVAEDLTPPGADVYRLDRASPSTWKAQPTWLSNPDPGATVERTAEGLQFTIPSPHKGMKWSTPLPPILITEQRYLMLRYKATNLDTTGKDYAVYLDDDMKEQFNTVRPGEIISDGEWHIHVVCLPTRTKAMQVSGAAAVQVQAGDKDDARLVVSDLLFTDAVNGAVLSPQLRAEMEKIEGEPKEGFRMTFASVEGWKEQPSWFQQDLAGKASLAAEGGIAHFSVEGPAKSRMKWSFNLPSPPDTAAFPDVALRYKGENLGRANDYALFVGGSTEGNVSQGGTAILSTDLESDGAWHTAGGQVTPLVTSAREVAIQVEIAKDGRADLWVESLAFLDRPVKPMNELPEAASGHPGDIGNFKMIELPKGALDPAALQRVLSLRTWFPSNEVTVGGIPFGLGGVIETPLRGRDTIASAPASGRASEVWLLLGARFRGEEEPGFDASAKWAHRQGKIIPASAMREPIRVCVELVHEDGSDFAVPVNVRRREQVITKGLNLYCIPTRLKGDLKQIVLHDDTDLGAFYITGIALNASDRPRLEGFKRDEPAEAVKQVPAPAPTPPTVTLEDKKLVLQSGAYQYEFDLTNGLRLTQATSRIVGGPVCVKTADFSLFTVTVDKKTASAADFTPTGPPRRLGENEVEVDLASPASLRNAELSAKLGLKAGPSELICSLRIKNEGRLEVKPAISFPDLGSLGISGSVNDTHYFHPKRGAAFGKEMCNLRSSYGGSFPFQFMDVYAPPAGGGLYLRTMDMDLEWKWYVLSKRPDGARMAVEYLDRPLAPGEERVLPAVALGMHAGDWRAAQEAYRKWLTTWYKSLGPRPKWYREVFNFRQEFLYFQTTKLFDAKAKRFDILGEIADVKDQFGGCDYMHIFDWGYTKQFGRCGDYNHWEDMGGAENFRQAVKAAQDAGVPVGLYIEGYLVSPPSNLGKAHGAEWQLLDAKGKPYPYFPPDYNMCANVKEWQDYLAATYKRVAQETGVKGFYIDEFGFANQGHFCYNANHKHEVPAPPLRGEMELTCKVRTALNETGREIALYTEESPCDVTSQYQDGSFTYALSSYPKPPDLLNIYRFVLPDFKLFEIIICDGPLGSNYEAVRRVFFNGNGLWIEGRADDWFAPKTRAEIARLHRVLRLHKDAFTGSHPTALVPTLKAGVLANEFPSDASDKTVYTIFNANYWSVGGPIITLPYKEGTVYQDGFTGQELRPTLGDGGATIQLDLKPRDVACIVVRKP